MGAEYLPWAVPQRAMPRLWALLALVGCAGAGRGPKPGSRGSIRVVSIGGVGTSYVMAYMNDLGFRVAQSGAASSCSC